MLESVADQALAVYAELISKGVARETARMVLPCSTYTSFWMTGNLHNWCKYIRLRDTDHVQLETRLATQAIRAQLIERFPVSMSALLSDEYS
jgi:thymidylate synthase (FAD)